MCMCKCLFVFCLLVFPPSLCWAAHIAPMRCADSSHAQNHRSTKKKVNQYRTKKNHRTCINQFRIKKFLYLDKPKSKELEDTSSLNTYNFCSERHPHARKARLVNVGSCLQFRQQAMTRAQILAFIFVLLLDSPQCLPIHWMPHGLTPPCCRARLCKALIHHCNTVTGEPARITRVLSRASRGRLLVYHTILDIYYRGI